MAQSDSPDPSTSHLASAYRVFVSIAADLRLELVSEVKNRLRQEGLLPSVYRGVKRPPAGEGSTALHGAVDDLYKAQILVILVASNLSGAVSDDWALEELPAFISYNRPALIFLVPAEVHGKNVPESKVRNLGASVVRILVDDDRLPDELAKSVQQVLNDL